MNTEAEKAVNELYTQEGELDPERVIEVAKDPDSPLHSCFEWNDTRAGHAYRVLQAKRLIRKVRYTYEEGTVKIAVPKYLQKPSAKEKGKYTETTSLRSREDERREALSREFSRVSSALERARQVATALGWETEGIEALQSRTESVRFSLLEDDSQAA